MSGGLRRMWVAYAVLLVGLLITAVAFEYVRRDMAEAESARFERATRLTREAIDSRLEVYTGVVRGLDGLFSSQRSVSPQEWEAYMQGLNLPENYPGLQAAGYVEHVNPGERQEFLGSDAGQRIPEARTSLYWKQSPAYTPVIYASPENLANEYLLARDLYADPSYQRAMDRARDEGAPAVTRLAYLLSQPQGKERLIARPGFAVFMPVYEFGEEPQSLSGRREDIRGYVFATFRTDRIFGDQLVEPVGLNLDFEAYDGARPTYSGLLYDTNHVVRGVERNAEDVRIATLDALPIAGSEWRLYFGVLPGGTPEARLPYFVAASGLVVSLLLFTATWLLVRARIRAEIAGWRLAEANSRLARSNQELESFTYTVSHDLQAPLRGIDGFSRILEEDYGAALDAQGREYLGRLQAAAGRMRSLIEDLLQLSRAGRTEPARREVDLSALAREVFEELRQGDPGREVRLRVAEGLSAMADPRLARMALENLLGNAWKFTADEHPAVIEFGEKDGAYYVSDNGVGFEPEESGKIFDAFQRLHSEKEFAGTGIGLATVRKVAIAHGGRAWAEGEMGEGATFYFTLGGEDGG